ncbi:MAG: HAD-IA family hydrolase, partial [Alteraurantiacibacter sp.]
TGFRMVTLMNSPGNSSRDPLADAGLAHFFEQRFTVDPVKRFKPSPVTYDQVTDTLSVSPDQCLLVAAHLWDTIGAQAMGWKAALVTRGMNATIPIDGVPQPDLVVNDMTELSHQLIERFAGR